MDAPHLYYCVTFNLRKHWGALTVHTHILSVSLSHTISKPGEQRKIQDRENHARGYAKWRQWRETVAFGRLQHVNIKSCVHLSSPKDCYDTVFMNELGQFSFT